MFVVAQTDPDPVHTLDREEGETPVGQYRGISVLVVVKQELIHGSAHGFHLHPGRDVHGDLTFPQDELADVTSAVTRR